MMNVSTSQEIAHIDLTIEAVDLKERPALTLEVRKALARISQAHTDSMGEYFLRLMVGPKPYVPFEESVWPPKPPSCGCRGIFHTCANIT